MIRPRTTVQVQHAAVRLERHSTVTLTVRLPLWGSAVRMLWLKPSWHPRSPKYRRSQAQVAQTRRVRRAAQVSIVTRIFPVVCSRAKATQARAASVRRKRRLIVALRVPATASVASSGMPP